jgi:hypothetical protein
MAANEQAERVSRMDYDIHGIVGVRLIDPLPSDVAMVTRQIGPLHRPLSREPDIIIRFVEHLPTGRLRFVELNRTAFSEHGFFVLESGKHKAKVRLPFEQIGKRCEIVCESGLRAIPHLMAIVNLTALTRDVVALHASAFVYADMGVVVTGWAKGGKTEALLAFASRGASYIGDEWVLLSGDGQHMYGIPENIRLWDWHLQNLPYLQSEIPLETRLRFASIHFLQRIERSVLRKFFGKTLPARTLREAMPALARQLNIRFDPQTIFRGNVGPCAARPDKVFLMTNDHSDVVTVEPADAGDIAERMISSVRFEQFPIMGDYLAFKFAFPGMQNEVLEHAHEMQHDILQRALFRKEAYTVRHPYPVAFGELYEAMTPYVERAGQAAERPCGQLTGVSHSYGSPEVA